MYLVSGDRPVGFVPFLVESLHRAISTHKSKWRLETAHFTDFNRRRTLPYLPIEQIAVTIDVIGLGGGVEENFVNFVRMGVFRKLFLETADTGFPVINLYIVAVQSFHAKNFQPSQIQERERVKTTHFVHKFW